MKQLPRGRHGLSPEFVARHQRERLVAGATQALHEVGYPEVTVGLIGKYASVSKSDFYKHFLSKGDCFDVAFDTGVGQIRDCVQGACAGNEEGWASGVRAAIAALLALLSERPPLASLVLVEGLRAGPSVRDRYRAAMSDFVPLLNEGAPSPLGATAPGEIGETVVGGVASLLARKVLIGDAEYLVGMEAEVVEFALAPYLGVAEARRIVSPE